MGRVTAERGPKASASGNAQRWFAFALMVIAGWCDGAGFLLFAQLYVSFMSGDATQFGLQLGSGHWAAAARFFGAQALFVFGAGLGRSCRLDHPARGRRAILAINAVLLGATALVGGILREVPAYAFAIIAMGLQNATATREAGVPVGTMITGTLARLGENLADRLRGRPSPIIDNAGQWLFFVLGTAGGAIAYGHLGAGSFWVPAVGSAVMVPLAKGLPAMVREPEGEVPLTPRKGEQS